MQYLMQQRPRPRFTNRNNSSNNGNRRNSQQQSSWVQSPSHSPRSHRQSTRPYQSSYHPNRYSTNTRDFNLHHHRLFVQNQTQNQSGTQNKQTNRPIPPATFLNYLGLRPRYDFNPLPNQPRPIFQPLSRPRSSPIPSISYHLHQQVKNTDENNNQATSSTSTMCEKINYYESDNDIDR